MSKQAEKELVKVETGKLTQREEVPDFLKDVKGGTGLEAMEQGDMVLPRLAIAQSLSPAIKKNNSKYIEGLEEGMLYNTVTRRIYGTTVRVVPVLFSKMRIKFEEISKGGGILCISANGIDGGQLCPAGCARCEFSKFIDGVPPKCSNFMNYACLLPDEGMDLIVASMKSTAISVAKQWNSVMRLLNKPSFAKFYQISTVPETRNNNDYFNFKVEPKNFVTPEIYSFGTAMHEQLKAQGIKVDLEDEDLQDPTQFDTNQMGNASQEM